MLIRTNCIVRDPTEFNFCRNRRLSNRIYASVVRIQLGILYETSVDNVTTGMNN